jgi:DtxR family transcriptional regulator, Mn-dependent transcriptional regulator
VTTASVENYLKAILQLETVQGRASTALLARRLGVAPASVTEMLTRLARGNPAYVFYEKHRGAFLTDTGRKRALEVVRAHRLIECFLHDELGYTWDEVHEEAERLEHAASPRFAQRIAHKLGYPERDPHGHPIPPEDGRVVETREVFLNELNAGASATVASVDDDDAGVLRRLSELGIRPDIEIRMMQVTGDPAAGVTILCGDPQEQVELPVALASRIKVALGGDEERRAGTGGAGEMEPEGEGEK